VIFRRARLRLTALYIVLFALVLLVFSAVFYGAFVTVLQPDFDIAPEVVSSGEAARTAYETTVGRIAAGLAIADAAAIVVVGGIAWLLATRTLDPIREAHQRQQRFVADASHEIRNPLAAIKSSAQAALRPDAPPDELRAALESVAASADRLTRLTNDLLSLARPDGALADHSERCDLSVATAEALEEYLAAEGRKPPVAMSLAPDLAIAANPGEVGRIVRNLVENAIRHAGDGVRVRVVTRAGERDAILEVTDDGRGIAAADIAHIFEPFHRLRAARDTEGTGLGLAIAADLAARNHARLSVRSMVGTGSTFRVVFPRLR
jgi:signal transduction histidine kinase